MFRIEFLYHSPTVSVPFVLSTLNGADILCMIMKILAFNPNINLISSKVDPTFYNINS